MVIPDWFIRRIALSAFIFLEVFAAKGYFPHKWALLSIIISTVLWIMILRPTTITLARKNSE